MNKMTKILCAMALVAVAFVAMSFSKTEMSGSGNCVDLSLTAREDGETVGIITFRSNCTFAFCEYVEDGTKEWTRGTYSLSNEFEKGAMCTVSFYVDGSYIGGGNLCWYVQNGIVFHMGGYDFKP